RPCPVARHLWYILIEERYGDRSDRVAGADGPQPLVRGRLYVHPRRLHSEGPRDRLAHRRDVVGQARPLRDHRRVDVVDVEAAGDDELLGAPEQLAAVDAAPFGVTWREMAADVSFAGRAEDR